MVDILSVENMRRSDAHTIEKEVPGKELMMRAAKGIFDSVDWKALVGIVCGSGNNAGDGYALAAIMKDRGYDVTVLKLVDKFSEDGKHYNNLCAEKGVPVIDCLSSEEAGRFGEKEGFEGARQLNLILSGECANFCDGAICFLVNLGAVFIEANDEIFIRAIIAGEQ